MILFALFGPLFIPYDSGEQTGASFEAPSSSHLLGTNDIGQDILAELADGARTSLFLGVSIAICATLIGAIIGITAGYIGGWYETIMMRIIDVVLTLPFLPLMIVVSVYMGQGLFTEIFIITVVMWAGKARQIRAQTLSIKSLGPVQAATAMGANHFYIFKKHILPGVFPLLIPQFVAAVNAAILLESSLSFLGLGNPLQKSWGSILYYANNRSAFLTDAWAWWIVPPGICIVMVVLGFSFIGYFLEEKVNPRLSSYTVAKKRPKQAVATSACDFAKDIVLNVQNVSISYGQSEAVTDVSFEVKKGRVLGIVGESGSGKTTIVTAINAQLKGDATITKGSIFFNGENMEQFSDERIRDMHGKDIGYIAQAAMNALNPVMKIKFQLKEAITQHYRLSRHEINERIDEVLCQVGLDPKWKNAYPHELSGGMKQRVVIAMGIINKPQFVIADEPTTGLDVMVQVEIIQLLKKLQQELNISMIFISHDLPAVLTLTDDLIIMKYGQIVDFGPSTRVAKYSTHPYTRRLVDSIPTLQLSKNEEVKPIC
ncbi:MAG: dipeptide/oligopeptide/nickel ABC transporter permease/ATP-binding protein [Kurthia sp.]|nr:dipeptide/oligopeptide/nickel ABC transporter permease/ATP-binding protein [Candidatus Kurthia equi]